MKNVFYLTLLLCFAIALLRNAEGQEENRGCNSLGSGFLKTCLCSNPDEGYGICWERRCDLCGESFRGKRSSHQNDCNSCIQPTTKGYVYGTDKVIR